MKNLILILTIFILATSCASNSFTKRKYTKGRYISKVENYNKKKKEFNLTKSKLKEKQKSNSQTEKTISNPSTINQNSTIEKINSSNQNKDLEHQSITSSKKNNVHMEELSKDTVIIKSSQNNKKDGKYLPKRDFIPLYGSIVLLLTIIAGIIVGALITNPLISFGVLMVGAFLSLLVYIFGLKSDNKKSRIASIVLTIISILIMLIMAGSMLLVAFLLLIF